MLALPFWFNQRQCKAEEVADNFYRVTAPNMPETYLGIRKAENGLYQGYLRSQQDGPDEAVTDPEFQTVYQAWEAAFELFREVMIL